MARFSKLKKRIEGLFVPNLGLEVHCTVYHKKHHHGTLEIPRLWLTLNKEIIFDFGKDFEDLSIPVPNAVDERFRSRPYYWSDISDINNLIQKYIETPVTLIFDCVSENDHFGIIDILRAADRRIGKKRLIYLKDKTQSQPAKKIIDVRLSFN